MRLLVHVLIVTIGACIAETTYATNTHEYSFADFNTSDTAEQPSLMPSLQPNSTDDVSAAPTGSDTSIPSSAASSDPTGCPSGYPTGVPTSSSPTASPTTTAPTAIPTLFPTPVYTTTLIVDVGQTLLNCSAIEYKKTVDESDKAFKRAVHLALEGLPDASINILSVADASNMLSVSRRLPEITAPEMSRSGANLLRSTVAMGKAITVTYLFSVVIEAAGYLKGEDAFNYIAADLEYSVSSGKFTDFIQAAAVEFGSHGLEGAIASKDGLNIHSDYLLDNASPKPSIQPTFKFGDANNKENSLEIIGPAVALVILIVCAIIMYYRCFGSSSDGDSFVALSQDVEGYDEIELMEKKAQMASLSQRGTNPLHRLREKNRKNKLGYANVDTEDESHHAVQHHEENGSFLSSKNVDSDVNY